MNEEKNNRENNSQNKENEKKLSLKRYEINSSSEEKLLKGVLISD